MQNGYLLVLLSIFRQAIGTLKVFKILFTNTVSSIWLSVIKQINLQSEWLSRFRLDIQLIIF